MSIQPPTTAEAKTSARAMTVPAETQGSPAQPLTHLPMVTTRPGSEQTVRAHAAALEQAGSGGQTGRTLVQLQRLYGNRYVQRLVAQSSERPTPLLQPKLMLGPVDDPYEREADRVARAVVQRMAASTPAQQDEQSQSLITPGTVQRSALAQGGAVDSQTEAAIESQRGQGQPLAADVRSAMEGAFGVNFSGVQVHTDGAADALNQSLQARAFTTGQDIFFRQGEYQPGGNGGRELIAHELSHVVQQTSLPNYSIQLQQHEQEGVSEPREHATDYRASREAALIGDPLPTDQFPIGHRFVASDVEKIRDLLQKRGQENADRLQKLSLAIRKAWFTLLAKGTIRPSDFSLGAVIRDELLSKIIEEAVGHLAEKVLGELIPFIGDVVGVLTGIILEAMDTASEQSDYDEKVEKLRQILSMENTSLNDIYEHTREMIHYSTWLESRSWRQPGDEHLLQELHEFRLPPLVPVATESDIRHVITSRWLALHSRMVEDRSYNNDGLPLLVNPSDLQVSNVVHGRLQPGIGVDPELWENMLSQWHDSAPSQNGLSLSEFGQLMLKRVMYDSGLEPPSDFASQYNVMSARQRLVTHPYHPRLDMSVRCPVNDLELALNSVGSGNMSLYGTGRTPPSRPQGSNSGHRGFSRPLYNSPNIYAIVKWTWAFEGVYWSMRTALFPIEPEITFIWDDQTGKVYYEAKYTRFAGHSGR